MNDCNCGKCDVDAFQAWWSRKDAVIDLNFSTLEVMYGTALITSLSHVFAGGWRRTHESLTGCWAAFEKAMKQYPDLFRAYAFTNDGNYWKSLRSIFKLGMDAE